MTQNSSCSDASPRSEGDHWGDENVATVSEVIGEGADAHRIVRVGAWEFVASTADSEPRIRDIDLAMRLGYERPYDIRDLIRRMMSDGKLNDVAIFRAARRNDGRGRPGREFWLTEAQALKVVAKSETTKADAILDEVIRVFLLARRGLLPSQRGAEPRGIDPERFMMALAPVLAGAMREGLSPLVDRLGRIEARLERVENARGGSVGIITPREAQTIKLELKAIATVRAAAGLASDWKSARAALDQRLRGGVGYAGTGRPWHQLPAHKLADVQRELDVMRREAHAAEMGAFAHRAAEAHACGMPTPEPAVPMSVEEYKAAEKMRMIRILNSNGWKVSETAAAMDISRRTFYRRLDEYGLRGPQSPADKPN